MNFEKNLKNQGQLQSETFFLGLHLTFRTILLPGSHGCLKVFESVVTSWRSSADWMPENMGKWSVGAKRRHPVTLLKAPFKILSIKQM